MEIAEVEAKILEAFAITYNKDVGTLTRDTLIREELSDKSILMRRSGRRHRERTRRAHLATRCQPR